jgi:hypothetical protein
MVVASGHNDRKGAVLLYPVVSLEGFASITICASISMSDVAELEVAGRQGAL